MLINIVCISNEISSQIKDNTKCYIDKKENLSEKIGEATLFFITIYQYHIQINSLYDNKEVYDLVQDYIETIFGGLKIGVYGNFNKEEMNCIRNVSIYFL